MLKFCLTKPMRQHIQDEYITYFIIANKRKVLTNYQTIPKTEYMEIGLQNVHINN